MSSFTQQSEEYVKAARDLAAALVTEAESFLLAKMADDKCTDGKAERMAVVETKGQATIAEAKLFIARLSLMRAANGVVETRLN